MEHREKFKRGDISGREKEREGENEGVGRKVSYSSFEVDQFFHFRVAP